MGRVAAPYGVRGWIRVQPFTGAPDALLQYPIWWFGKGGATRAMTLKEGRMHAGAVLAKIEGIESREDAMRYRGSDVAVEREALPAIAENEVYVHELVGLAVVNRRGDALGKVKSIAETGAQPLLEVEGDGGVGRLIPFAPGVVDEVDLVAGRVVVDWEADY